MRLKIIVSIILLLVCLGGCSEAKKDKKVDPVDKDNNQSSVTEKNKNNELKGGTDRMASDITKNTHLPAGSNPLAEKEDPLANSGEKGTLYYIKSNIMLQRLGRDTKTHYDMLKFVACLQGLLNREKPVMFMEFDQGTDQFWYAYLRKEDKLLYGYERIDIDDPDIFLKTFCEEIVERGIVLWDPDVPATANVASTICGVEGYLPVRYDETEGSLHNLLTKFYKVPVKMNLKGKFTGEGIIPDTNIKSSGSSKCDAYIWALEKYFDQTNKKIMAYVLDGISWNDEKVEYPDLNNAFVPNHDYVVANKAFAFDLSPWDDEAPCDDLDQPIGTDYDTLKKILQKQYDRLKGEEIIQVVGFVPWQIKYTSHLNKSKHEPVPTEWKYGEILSAYNCVMDADAAGYCGLANASLYRLYPLKDKYVNNKPKEKVKYDKNKKYVYVYMGDYDAAPWLTRFVPKWWNDPMRGEMPLAWAFNPNLSERVPMVFDFIYENKTDNDFFISGDSGAGYLNPTLLLPPRIHSDNPSGMDAWIKHNQYYFNQFDLSITGFIINGVHPTVQEVVDAYKEFSYNGVISNTLRDNIIVEDNVGFKKMDYDIGHGDNSVTEAADIILKRAKSRLAGPKFYAYRTILCSPTFMNAVQKIVKEKDPSIEFVDPFTYFELLKEAYKN